MDADPKYPIQERRSSAFHAASCSVLPVPFYRDEYVTIYHGDCRKIMPLLERFDLLMADPPYGISEDGKRSNRNRKGDGKWKAPSNKDYGANDWDDETVPGWLMELAREICDKQIIFGGNYYALPPAKGWIVWDKETDGKNGADCELAWSNALTSTKRIRHLWDGFRQKTLEPRDHPTQKPLAVIQWAIMQAGDVQTILDPWAGSGTTGHAAKNLGKRAVLIEREERYCEVAAARLAQDVLPFHTQNNAILKPHEK